MGEEYYWEVRITYPEGGQAEKFKAREIDSGVIALYGYNHIWREWRMVALRFRKTKFMTLEAVEKYLNERYKERVLGMLAGKMFNSKLRSEVQMLLSLANIKFARTAEVKGGWEWWG